MTEKLEYYTEKEKRKEEQNRTFYQRESKNWFSINTNYNDDKNKNNNNIWY